jgi:hypothetical protein
MTSVDQRNCVRMPRACRSLGRRYFVWLAPARSDEKNNNDVIGLVPAPCQLGNGVKWRHAMFAGATHAGTTSLL